MKGFFRIGDKLISREKILAGIEKILKLRSQGKSQHEVAEVMSVDRSFISRLENLGEMRKGNQIGAVGFPIKNTEEIRKVLYDRGVGKCLLMSETERNSFVRNQPGSDLVDELATLIREYRMYDTVLVLASDMRTKWVESLLDRQQQIIAVNIGTSPLTEDVYVEPNDIIEILDHLL